MDIGFLDIMGLSKDLVFKSDSRINVRSIRQQIQTLWRIDPKRDNILPTFCVRATLDLYFQIQKFPSGSEVIMTAINLPDMVQMVREHGLIPVPLDVDPKTMAPFHPDELRKLITPKTVCFLACYIYGVRYELDAYADVCDEYGIDVIEDVAQTFQGTTTWIGSPRAKLSMFSFGMIKQLTTINGAIGVVRDKRLHD